MTAVWVWLLAFGTGASLSMLLTEDSLCEPLRRRWETHFEWRMDQVLERVDAELSTEDTGSPDHLPMSLRLAKSTPERSGLLRSEIGRRAEEEPRVPFWVRGEARREGRVWTRRQAKLDRLASYHAFISCPRCAPFWVFLVVGWFFGFLTGQYELFAVGLPWPFWWLSFALAGRWVYAKLA